MTLAQMPDGTGWLMKPVLRQLCRYESLLDGSLTLMDLARMHDAMAVEEENHRRIRDRADGR